MRIVNKTWLASPTVATVYTISFYLIQWIAFNGLLAKYPSEHEDDVRADIGLPALLIAYVVALFCSYVAIDKSLHKTFGFKRFLLFCLLIPLLIPLVYQLTRLGLGLLAIMSSSYNHSSYFVYQISLVACTWITLCVAYWLAFGVNR